MLDDKEWAAFDLPVNAGQILSDDPEAQELNTPKAKDGHGERRETFDFQRRKHAEELAELDQKQHGGMEDAANCASKFKPSQPPAPVTSKMGVVSSGMKQ